MSRSRSLAVLILLVALSGCTTQRLGSTPTVAATVTSENGVPAPLAILRPHLGHIQIRVEQSLKGSLRHAHMHRHDAVVDLPHTSQILPLHAGGLGALLDDAGLVNEADDSQVVAG